MRASVVLIVALLIGFLPRVSLAQISETSTLAVQIRKQERMVKTEPGKGNGEVWLKLAILRQDAARYRESERAYRRAIALLKPGDPVTFADALDQMGTMYAECGQFSKAEPLERKALAIREDRRELVGIGISHMHLAVLLLGKREIPSAKAEAQRAVSLLVPEQDRLAVQSAATPEEKMTALIDLSLVRCAQGGCASAIPDLRRALQIAHANYVEDSIPIGFLDSLLGYALWKSGDNNSADELMRRGTQELSTKLGWGHPTYVQVLRQYSIFLNQTGHLSEAADIAARIAKLERSTEFVR